MRSRSQTCLFLLLSFILLASVRCSGDLQKKKIFYINSYHDGYPSSDDIRVGILETLSGEMVNLEIFYMDTKRNPEQEKVKEKVQKALDKVDSFSPDLIITSDDNAVGQLVVPHLQESGIPIVFCGVNWSAVQYSLIDCVTGMLEVLPLRECIQLIKDLNPDIRRIAVLSENSQSEKNNTLLLDTLYSNMEMKVEYRLVDNFEQWKEAFREVSISSDLIYLPTNGAIRNWDRKEAISFVEENLNVPTITCDDFMMDYCVFGLTKVAKEQGEWAARTALEILSGKSPSSIPYTRNRRYQAYLNKKLSERISFELLEVSEGGITELNIP